MSVPCPGLHAPSRTQTAANRMVESSTQYLLMAQVHAGILAELHLAPEYNECGSISSRTFTLAFAQLF